MHRTMRRQRFATAALLLLAGTAGYPVLRGAGTVKGEVRVTSSWPSYGNDPGGMRYAELTQVTPQNVSALKQAWVYSTRDKSKGGSSKLASSSAFEATPILAGGQLVFCTPFNNVVALDPLNGLEIWRFEPNPKVDLTVQYENQLTCRGVSAWTDKTPPSPKPKCSLRIFTGTNDGRLIALDGVDGKPCTDFGDRGTVQLREEADIGRLRWKGEYQVTSPPAIIGDIVVVGSAIADNQHTDAPSGVVRAFDVRTGKLKWAQDLVPKTYDGPRSQNGYALGGPNVWSIMSVDLAVQTEIGVRDLIYMPTGNPAPDFYRGTSRPPDKYGSSVVAVNASDGEIVWSFQTVHQDLWDYDVPSQPALFTYVREDGTEVPALAQGTKTGHLFILDRRNGRPLGPLFAVNEKPVPQSAVPGEQTFPTQPFPNLPEAMGLQNLPASDVKKARCLTQMEVLRSEGIFTPPSLRGTVQFPGSGGGLNWSGVAIDPRRRLLITNSTNIPWTVRLFPADKYAEEKRANPSGEVRPQDGTPYGMSRSLFTDIPLGLTLLQSPCNQPPWGHLNIMDLSTGKITHKTELGKFLGNSGLPSLGGAIVTSTGLAFIAGTVRDDSIRAFNVEGQELWKQKLPAGGQATPMTYEVDLPNGGGKRQFIVVAAGGQGRATTRIGDFLVAFSIDGKKE